MGTRRVHAALASIVLFAVAPRAALAELTMSLAASPDPVVSNADPGLSETFSFAITVTSVGAAAENVSVSFTVPPQFAVFDVGLASETVTCTSTIGAANLCYPTEVLTWPVGDLAAGQGRTLRLGLQVAHDEGDVDLPVSLFEDGIPVFAEPQRLQMDVVESRRLELAVAEARDPAPPGSQLTYTLTYGHPVAGDSSTNGLLRFFVPDGTTFASATPGCSEAAGIVSCPLGLLRPGEGGARRVTVAVEPGLPDGSVIVADADLASGFPAASARARAVTRIDADSNLVLALAGGRNPAVPAEGLDLELTVANRGDFTLFDVDLALEVPAGVDAIGLATASTAGVDAVACTSRIGAAGVCYPREMMTWSVGDLVAGQARTVRLPPSVAAGAASGSLIEWYAWARPAGGGEGPEFAEDGGAIQVQSDPKFDIAVVDDRDPAAPGTQLAYTIAFGHPVTADIDENVVVRFGLPDGVTFVSASRGAVPPGVDRVVRWVPRTLRPGVWFSHTVNVTVNDPVAPSGAGDLLEAWAEIEQAGIDAGPSAARSESSRAGVVTRVAPVSPLSLEVWLPNPPSEQDDVVSVEYRVRNGGAVDLLEVDFEGLIPEGVDAFSSGSIAYPPVAGSVAPSCLGAIGAGGTCYPGERVFWRIPELPAGPVPFTITVPYSLAASATDLPDGVVLPFRGLAAHGGYEAPDSALRAVPEPGAGLAGAAAVVVLGLLAARMGAQPAGSSRQGDQTNCRQ